MKKKNASASIANTATVTAVAAETAGAGTRSEVTDDAVTFTLPFHSRPACTGAQPPFEMLVFTRAASSETLKGLTM